MKLYSEHYQNQLRKLHQLKSSFGSAGKYKGLNEWIDKWKVNGWRASNKKSVKNKDLWVE